MNASEIIARLGGTAKAAELCEVTDSAVSQWKEKGFIPKHQMKFLRIARPDIFPEVVIRRSADKKSP